LHNAEQEGQIQLQDLDYHYLFEKSLIKQNLTIFMKFYEKKLNEDELDSSCFLLQRNIMTPIKEDGISLFDMKLI